MESLPKSISNPIAVLLDTRYLVIMHRFSIGYAIDNNSVAPKDSEDYNRAMAYIVSASFALGDMATAGKILDRAIEIAESECE